jgi:predicted ATP-grasp superfamily ATP-dependent carboligase
MIRSLTWPGVQVFGLRNPDGERDFVLVRGVEPSMRWRSFASELLDLADDLEVELVITLGSMLADTPHTRAIPVSGTGAHPDIAARLGVEVSRYEGPTGILAVIQDGCVRRGIDAIALWAAVPHYANATPSPKATLALVNGLEDFLEISLPQGTLPDLAITWENAVTEMVKEDSDIEEYIKTLEESKDANEISDESGEELAREVERFLRRQNNSNEN